MKNLFLILICVIITSCREDSVKISEEYVYFIEEGDLVPYSFNFYGRTSGGIKLILKSSKDSDFGGTSRFGKESFDILLSNDSIYIVYKTDNVDKYGETTTNEVYEYFSTINSKGILEEKDAILNINKSIGIDCEITKLTIK